MSKLKEQIQNDYILSFKAQDKDKMMVLREAKGKIATYEKENTKLKPDFVQEVLQAMAKSRRQSIEAYTSGGRDDLVVKEQFELNLLEEYLPKVLSEDEVREAIANVITQFDINDRNMKIMGQVMKAFKELYQGQDGKLVSKIVREVLS